MGRTDPPASGPPAGGRKGRFRIDFGTRVFCSLNHRNATVGVQRRRRRFFFLGSVLVTLCTTTPPPMGKGKFDVGRSPLVCSSTVFFRHSYFYPLTTILRTVFTPEVITRERWRGGGISLLPFGIVGDVPTTHTHTHTSLERIH